MEQHEIDDMMSNLQDYLERQNINTSRFFRCLNPQHIDSNASMKYFDDCKVYCFGCGCCFKYKVLLPETPPQAIKYSGWKS